MLTKSQFCKMVIQNFKDEEKIITLNESDILKSSNLAVAMEYLTLLNDEELKRYASGRGGNLYFFIDDETKEVSTLSLRELLGLLPE